MADAVLTEDGDAAEDADGAAPKPKGKKKLILIAAVALIVLLLGGGGAAWFLMGGKKGAAKEAATEKKLPGKDAFVDVPPMLVNLRASDGNPHFLKLHFMLVLGPKAKAEELKDQLPLVLDAYQPFLRELRPEDLAGSAAVFRIKEEMLVRTRDALGDGMVDDILIQDLVQQ